MDVCKGSGPDRGAASQQLVSFFQGKVGFGQFAGVARSGCDWQLSPTKRTEKTRLEYVGLTAPCPSATGHKQTPS